MGILVRRGLEDNTIIGQLVGRGNLGHGGASQVDLKLGLA